MMFLVACGMLTLGVAVTLGWPFWRALKSPAANRSAYDLNVYRVQLSDLDRDLERGLIEADDAHLLRLEIERRILRADALGTSEIAAKPIKRHWPLLVLVIAVVLLLPVGFYLGLGSPLLEDQPFRARASKIVKMQDQAAKLQDLVSQLQTKLQANPDDGNGWEMLGHSLRILRQNEQAKTALLQAIKLMPDQVKPRLEYGATLIADLPEGARLPDEFVSVMRNVLAMQDDVPEALYFVGLAETQDGHDDKARSLWTKLLDKLPAGSEDHAELQRQIDALK